MNALDSPLEPVAPQRLATAIARLSRPAEAESTATHLSYRVYLRGLAEPLQMSRRWAAGVRSTLG